MRRRDDSANDDVSAAKKMNPLSFESVFFLGYILHNLLILGLRALHLALSASEDVLGRWFRRRRRARCAQRGIVDEFDRLAFLAP